MASTQPWHGRQRGLPIQWENSSISTSVMIIENGLALRPLDLDAVQAFVLVADLASFTRAAEALDTTQSAVSLKLKRLEGRLGRRLLERTPRRVRLSAEGVT